VNLNFLVCVCVVKFPIRQMIIIIICYCGDNSLAGFNVEVGNEVGLEEGFGVGSFDCFVNEEGTVVGFNEGDVIGLFGGLDEK